MTNKSKEISRRTLLKGLAAIPVIAAVGYHTVASAEMVKTDDPTAAALEYTENSQKDGQSCATCSLYQGGAAASGPCPIFPGKDVAATGWCKSWIAKS